MSSINFKINKINKESLQNNDVCFVEAVISIDNIRKFTVRSEKISNTNSTRSMYIPIENNEIIPELSVDTKEFIENILKAYILGAKNVISFDLRTNCIENNYLLER